MKIDTLENTSTQLRSIVFRGIVLDSFGSALVYVSSLFQSTNLFSLLLQKTGSWPAVPRDFSL